MSYDAGALLFKLQTTGKQVFKQEMEEAAAAIDKTAAAAESSAGKVSKTGESLDKTGKAAKDAKAPLEETAKSTKKIGDESDTAAPKVKTLGQKIKETEGELRTVGGTMAGVGAALAAATGLTAKAAIDWETAWTGVTKTVDGTPAQLAQVEDGLRGLAKELPSSHTEIAAVAEAAGQLGIQTGSIVAFTKTMIDLGETTNLSAEEAATALARFMNVMGTSQGDVDRLGSSVVELGNNYATTEAEIVAMASRLAGAAHQIGLTEGQTIGLAAALSSVGIEAEAGGSALSKVMIDIASSVDKGGDRLDKFAKISGLSADAFAAKWKSDPGAALALFVKGLAEAEAQGTSTFAILEDLGITEVRMRDALLKSAAASDQFAGAMQMGNKAFRDNNALTAEAEKRYGTVESKLKAAGNAVVDAAIDFGQVFLPVLAGAADAITKVATGFADLPEPIQGVISVVGALGAIVGLSGGAFLLALPKIVEFRTALQVLAASTIPGVSAAAGAMTVATTRASAAMGSLARFMKGPWGLAFLAASAVVAGLNNEIQKGQPTAAELQNSLMATANAATALKTATKRSDTETFFWGDYADSLKDINGLLEKRSGDGFLDWLNLKPNQLGALDSISKLGDELGTMAANDLPAAQEAFVKLSRELGVTSKRQYDLLDAMPAYKEALVEEATARGIVLEGLTEEQKKKELVKIATGEGVKANKDAADAYLEAADGADALADKLSKLIDKINEVNGINQDAVSANAEYQSSLAGIAEEVERQKKAYEDANDTMDGFSLSLDESTVAGSANAAMLSDVAKSAQEAAASQYEVDKRTMGAKDATDKYISTLATNRQAFIDNAIAAGFNADEVQKVADKVYGLPTAKEIDILVNTAQATRDVDNWIMGMNGKQVRIAMGAGGTGGITKADGGKVNFYADGGRENHIAQWAAAGTMRVWAEPETGGEWYIPASPAKRQRSTQVLEAAATEFGYRLVPRNAQSFAPSAPAAAEQRPIINNNYAAPAMDIDHFAELVAIRMARKMR